MTIEQAKILLKKVQNNEELTIEEKLNIHKAFKLIQSTILAIPE